MKVKDLIALLQASNPEAEVIMSRDSEGNGYSPLYGADDAVYVPASKYSGDVYSSSWGAEGACMTEADWQEMLSRPHCVVLYPTK